jgi:hypothetical protein
MYMYCTLLSVSSKALFQRQHERIAAFPLQAAAVHPLTVDSAARHCFTRLRPVITVMTVPIWLKPVTDFCATGASVMIR